MFSLSDPTEPASDNKNIVTPTKLMKRTGSKIIVVTPSSLN